MKKQKLTYLLLVLLPILLLAACSDSPKRIPSTMPDVHGYIGTIKRSATNGSSVKAIVLVKAMEGLQADFPDATIRIDEDTKIEDADGKSLSIADLREGHEIEAWFEGDLLESVPAQGYAKAIRIRY